MSELPRTATVRVMSPEEIAARAGGETPYLQWPQRSTLFAERAMRLRQLGARHAMGEFLQFMAEVAQAQHDCLQQPLVQTLPDAAALDEAAQRGVPPLPAAEGPGNAAWHAVLASIVQAVATRAPAALAPTLHTLRQADAVFLDRQADALLTGVMEGLDLAAAPLVAAALQVQWTDALLQVQARHAAQGQPLGRLDDDTVCPCCGSRPVASLTRSGGESLGQRYLHCSLCSLQWYRVRGKCAQCGHSEKVAYQSLDLADGNEEEQSRRAAQAAVQAETCEHCHHYLKIMHSDRDPFVDPVADDLATLTLDLLISEAGFARHGLNLMLLFGEPEPEAAAPPDPGAR